MRYAYSLNDEDYDLTEVRDAENAAMASAHECGELSIGDELSFYKAEIFDYKGSDFFRSKDLECLYEIWDERAHDIAGEPSEGFSCVTSQADQELDGFIRYWMDKHIKPEFYGVRKSSEVKFEVTKEMYDEFYA